MDYNNHSHLTWGFTCSYCGGSGTIQSSNFDETTCHKCNGHGQTEELQNICTNCNGSGYVLEEQEESKFCNVQCHQCHGTGTIRK
jgi:DnaJ-class molecular chaperone